MSIFIYVTKPKLNNFTKTDFLDRYISQMFSSKCIWLLNKAVVTKNSYFGELSECFYIYQIHLQMVISSSVR